MGINSNKIGFEDNVREIPKEEAISLCNTKNIIFGGEFDVNSLSDIEIKEFFKKCVRIIYDKIGEKSKAFQIGKKIVKLKKKKRFEFLMEKKRNESTNEKNRNGATDEKNRNGSTEEKKRNGSTHNYSHILNKLKFYINF